MQVGVLGISFKTAQLSLRERLAGRFQELLSSPSLAKNELFAGAVFVHTCNRTELYFSASDLVDMHSVLISLLREQMEEEFEHMLYSYFGFECFLHLAKVTAGIDSAVVAETEIQGQIKRSYREASLDISLPSVLHFLFQKSLMVGKKVRSCWEGASGMPSFEQTFWKEIEKFSGQGASILFVGASEVNMKLLKSAGRKSFAKELFLSNRTEKKGKAALSSLNEVQWLPWKGWDRYEAFDVICFGTSSSKPLISKKDLSKSSNKKRLLIDLSVPRNIDDSVQDLPFVNLVNIEQLHDKLQAVGQFHKVRMLQAQKLVEEETEKKFFFYQRKSKHVCFFSESRFATVP